MKTLLAQESKFGGQMTKCKSDDQRVFLISNGVLTVVNIYYFLHQCFFVCGNVMDISIVKHLIICERIFCF
jgi:hypothetical protein